MKEKLKLLHENIGRLFFGTVILIALLSILESAPKEYANGEWFSLFVTIGLSVCIVWDYLTDWCHKIK